MNHAKKFVCVAGVMTIASAPAGAQTPWVKLSPNNALLTELDTSSVRRAADGLVVVRIRQFAGGGMGSAPPAYTVEVTQVDCQRKRSRVLEIRDDAKGVTPPRQGLAAPDSSRWMSYPRSSLGAEIQDATCRVADRGNPAQHRTGS